MAHYAAQTTVTPERSRAEIEHTLSRYGAKKFAYMRDDDEGWARIQFVIGTNVVQIELPLPKATERRFTHTKARGSARTPEAARKEWEQACRQGWRALGLVIKAKLEAVEAGISTFEQEFMAHMLLPNGQTAGEVLLPRILQAQTSREMLAALPWSGA
jgi:HEXXH motif-containing protein